MLNTTFAMAALAAISPQDPQAVPEFNSPVRLQANGQAIQVEQPGYASPEWFDVNGDGKRDLIVGQFNDGKMKVYHNTGDGKFADGEWLMAGDDVAEVPGVW